MNLEQHFNLTYEYQKNLAKDKKAKAKDLVKIAERMFKKGQLTGMQLGQIAYANKERAF